MTSLKLWLKGLAAAAIGGAVLGATEATANGHITKQTATVAGAGAFLAVLAYLTRSPLPPSPGA